MKKDIKKDKKTQKVLNNAERSYQSTDQANQRTKIYKWINYY